tara:strand:- start:2463 stop:3047 length:585 start_codon:yes stop_codon:yes gene_type:complete
MATQDSRIRLKRSTVAGAQPAAAPSADHTDGTWSVNDVYVGELYLNDTDQRLYVRTTGGVLEIATGGGELKRAQITLTTAQVLALNSTPITMVTGIAGKEIQVVSASAHLKYNSATYATNVNLVLKSSSAAAAEYQGKYDISYASDVLGTFELTGLQANIVTGNDLVATVTTGNPTAGDSDIVVDILYRVTDLA